MKQVSNNYYLLGEKSGMLASRSPELTLSIWSRQVARQSRTCQFGAGKSLTRSLRVQRSLLIVLLFLLPISRLCISASSLTPSDTVKPGDIVINEVMASPKGVQGLPETDYVELYNASGRSISLKEWTFIYDNTVIRLPNVPLAAGHYAVIYHKGKPVSANKKALTLGLSDFPTSMSNTGKQLTLKDPSGMVIHAYFYPKAKDGQAIERGEGEKWHLSSDPRGGTPGEENSSMPSVPKPKPDDPTTQPRPSYRRTRHCRLLIRLSRATL